MLENNIKNLIKILEESNVDELEISTFWGKQKIRIRKNEPSIKERNIELIQDTDTLDSKMSIYNHHRGFQMENRLPKQD